MNNLYNYQAIKLANNEADWMIYFKSLAQYFVKAFTENYEELQGWSNWVDENQTDVNNESIKNHLMSYYQLFLGLSPDLNNNLDIKKEILNKFVRIKDFKRAENEKIVNLLRLKKCEILGNLFTIDQLMNITLSFFHEVKFRIEFFNNIIHSSRESLQDTTTISQLLSKTEISAFNSINA